MIGREPPEHARIRRRPGMLCNAVMAGAPGHRFRHAVLDRARPGPKILHHHEVVSSTGPLPLTDVFEAHGGDDVHVVGHEAYCPFSSRNPDLAALARGRPGQRKIRRRAVGAGTYAVHYRWNTGVRDLAGPLHNPHPGALAGFRRRQGLDSPGGDLGCAGRDAPRLTELARPRPEVVGFNTDVYLKWRLRPRGQWESMRYAGANEDLYVREATRWPALAGLRLRPLGAGRWTPPRG